MMANYLLRDIPDDLLKEFKGACALKGTTMKDRIIELIKMDTLKKIVLKTGTLTAEDKKAILVSRKVFREMKK
jgi:hypothetical protein